MDPNHLKQEELNYELKIRGVSSSGTVDIKRRLLRGCLSQESANRSFQEAVVHPYTHQEDADEVKVTMDELRQLIDGFSGDRSGSVFRRINSRLIHLARRISKIPTEDTDEETTKMDLNQALLILEGDLDSKLSTNVSPPLASTPTNPHNPVNIGCASPGCVTQTSSRTYVAPYKWNLSFSGSNHTESINSFLEKVECLRETRGVSKDELFRSAGDLFKGPAWTWFLNNRHRVQNWDELVEKLKENFLPYSYQEDLEREINSRTQGSNERVCLFISAMEGLFNRLNVRPDEATIVNRICRNLLPFYVNHLALRNPTTISELITLCKRLEESKLWSERYRPPPNPRSGLIEPDLACSTYKSANSASNNPRNAQRIFNPNISHNVTTLTTVKCWNCNVVGHRHHECTKPKVRFCYGCGRKDMIRPFCPRCSPGASKNAAVGVRDLETGTSVVVLSPEPSTSVAPTTSQTTPNKVKGKK